MISISKLTVFVIHGCGTDGEHISKESQRRCDEALKYIKNGDIIIVSGGVTKNHQHGISEAMTMAYYLTHQLKNKKIDCEIFLEERSQTTISNVEEILSLHSILLENAKEVFVVTSIFNKLRAKLIWHFLLKRFNKKIKIKTIACRSAISWFKVMFIKLPIEIVGLIITFFYFKIGWKYPELLFRKKIRTEKLKR